MKREEVIKQITESDGWNKGRVKEEALDELEAAADQEGCEWGEQTPQVIELYRNLQHDYVSKEFATALYNEIINLYIHMLEWTEVVELPEREETVTIKKPAVKRREWVY